MFDRGNLFSDDSHTARDAAPAGAIRARANEALRAIDWSELTARLNAARDLRRELREDAVLCAGASGASFGDAAASYFKALGNGDRSGEVHGKQGVNPDALEGRKAFHGMPPLHSGDALKAMQETKHD